MRLPCSIADEQRVSEQRGEFAARNAGQLDAATHRHHACLTGGEAQLRDVEAGGVLIRQGQRAARGEGDFQVDAGLAGSQAAVIDEA